MGTPAFFFTSTQFLVLLCEIGLVQRRTQYSIKQKKHEKNSASGLKSSLTNEVHGVQGPNNEYKR
jgi:hypothetical protein